MGWRSAVPPFGRPAFRRRQVPGPAAFERLHPTPAPFAGRPGAWRPRPMRRGRRTARPKTAACKRTP